MGHQETNSNLLLKTCKPSFFFSCGTQRAWVVGWKIHYVAIGLAAINWGSWKKQLNAKSPWWEPATHRVQLWITPLRCLAEMGVWRRNMPLNRWNHCCDRSHVWNDNPKWKALVFQSTRHNSSLAVFHQRRLVSYSTPPGSDMNGNATNQEGKPRENCHSEKGVRSHNRGRVLRNAKKLKIYPSGQFTCQGFKIKKCGSYEGPVWRKHAEELGIEGSLGNSLRHSDIIVMTFHLMKD